MQMKHMKKALTCILCTVLIVAMALLTTGCNDNAKENAAQESSVAIMTEGAVLGEGSNRFDFTVVDKAGNEVTCEIHTDETTVGAALLGLGLIEGEEGQYGLYVKTVNGITADYEENGTYWAFYVDGEYAMSGVDVMDIVEGSSYAFKVE